MSEDHTWALKVSIGRTPILHVPPPPLNLKTLICYSLVTGPWEGTWRPGWEGQGAEMMGKCMEGDGGHGERGATEGHGGGAGKNGGKQRRC